MPDGANTYPAYEWTTVGRTGRGSVAIRQSDD